MNDQPPGLNAYLKQQEDADEWNDAAEREAWERLDEMDGYELAELICLDFTEAFVTEHYDELEQAMIDKLAEEGWRPNE